MARGTCRHVKVYQKFSRAPGGETGESLNPNSQVTRVLYQLKIHWGCRFCGVPAARARGEEDVLTWGPPVKVNFELPTPNSVPGCTLARPTWRRMKKGPRVQSGRAVHVQVVCTLKNSHAPPGQTGGTTDPKLAVHMHTVPT